MQSLQRQWVFINILLFALGIGLALVGTAALFLLDAGRNSVFGWSSVIDLMIFVVLDGLFVGGFWAAMTGRMVFNFSQSWRLE
jgi:hypothetical protein